MLVEIIEFVYMNAVVTMITWMTMEDCINILKKRTVGFIQKT